MAIKVKEVIERSVMSTESYPVLLESGEKNE